MLLVDIFVISLEMLSQLICGVTCGPMKPVLLTQSLKIVLPRLCDCGGYRGGGVAPHPMRPREMGRDLRAEVGGLLGVVVIKEV